MRKLLTAIHGDVRFHASGRKPEKKFRQSAHKGDWKVKDESMTLVAVNGIPLTRETFALHARANRASARLCSIVQAQEGSLFPLFPPTAERYERLEASLNGAELSLRSLATADAIRHEIAPQVAALRVKWAILDAI
mgnify:CR=1